MFRRRANAKTVAWDRTSVRRVDDDGASSVSPECEGPRIGAPDGISFFCRHTSDFSAGNVITGLSSEGRMATLTGSEDEVDMPGAVM